MSLSTLPKRIETVVIGAGQAGLAISYHLTRAGRAHFVLEKAALLANARRNQRWEVTQVEGLYFLGMPWLDSRRSGLLFGVGEDAAFLAEHVAARAAAFKAVSRGAAR